MYTIKKEKKCKQANLKKSYIILYIIHSMYLHLYNIIDKYMNIQDIYSIYQARTLK